MVAVPEVTNCKLTISCPRSTDSERLYLFLVKNLGFKIIGISPLVVEKDSPTESDLSRLFRELELDTWQKLEQTTSCHALCDSLQEKDFSDQRLQDTSCDSQPVSRPGEYPGSNHGYHGTSSDLRLTSSSESRGVTGKEQETTLSSYNVSSIGRDASRESQPVLISGGFVGSNHGHNVTPTDLRLTSSSESRGVTGKKQETTLSSYNVSSIGRDASRESQPVVTSGGYVGSNHGYHVTSTDLRLTSSSENRGVTGKEQETTSHSNYVSSFGWFLSREKELVPSPGGYPGSSYGYQATPKDPKLTSSRDRGMSGKEQETFSPSKNVSSVVRSASRESPPVSRPVEYLTSSDGYQATSVDPGASCLGEKGATSYIASRDNSSYIFRGINGLQVHVLKASIINLTVDCIVNAANRRLKHADGIAKMISQAAGYKLEKECEDYTKYGGTVRVTDLFVSTGGLLRARYVLHAVGPKWNDYTDKNMCEEALRHTILRCLVEAGRLGCRSIAIPSISAAKAKMPKELCAEWCIDAAKMYDKFQEVLKSPLQNIYFVDVSDSMVDIISSCCQIKWYERIPDYLISKDWTFIENHLEAAQRKEEEAKNNNSIMNKICALTPFSSPDLKYPSSGETNNASSKTSGKSSYSTVASRGATEQSQPGAAATTKSYMSSTSQKNKTGSLRTVKKSAIEVNYEFENITLTVSSRRAFDHQPNLTLTVGSLFDELSSLAYFSVSGSMKRNDNEPNMKNYFNFFDVTKPGGNRSLLVCRLFPEPESTEKIKEAFKHLDQFNKTIFTSTSQAKKLVITSCFLYKDSNKKLQLTFAQCLLDCLKLFKKLSFKNIIVTGSEDALPVLMKVLESGNRKRIKPEGDGSDAYEPSKSVHKDLGTSVDSDNVCQICTIKPPTKKTPCCQQKICGKCKAKVEICPWCRKKWKIQLGDQPEGFMIVSFTSEDAAGYDMCGSYKIEYLIPHGIQEKHHPTPGASFDSLNRIAYIPMTKQGFQVLLLLRLAFIRRLTFTIGQSMTTSRSDTLTWNDIHHKTSLRGSAHGYPDPTYLDRVTQELFSKGVTIDSATDEESKDLDNFSNCVQGKTAFLA